jgi:hypothetical protein
MIREDDKEHRQRNIWQELESWAEGFKPWQKLALCHAVRYGTLADLQIDDVYSVFLHNNGLGDDPKVVIPEKITERPMSVEPSPIRLTRIDSLQAINLTESQNPTFCICLGGNRKMW